MEHSTDFLSCDHFCSVTVEQLTHLLEVLYSRYTLLCSFSTLFSLEVYSTAIVVDGGLYNDGSFISPRQSISPLFLLIVIRVCVCEWVVESRQNDDAKKTRREGAVGELSKLRSPKATVMLVGGMCTVLYCTSCDLRDLKSRYPWLLPVYHQLMMWVLMNCCTKSYIIKWHCAMTRLVGWNGSLQHSTVVINKLVWG